MVPVANINDVESFSDFILSYVIANADARFSWISAMSWMRHAGPCNTPRQVEPEVNLKEGKLFTFRP